MSIHGACSTVRWSKVGSRWGGIIGFPVVDSGAGSVRICKTAEPHSSGIFATSTRSRSLRFARQARRTLYWISVIRWSEERGNRMLVGP